MSWWQAVVLGLVQGVTEILPVSSDGHLAVVQRLLGMPAGTRVALTAALHLGTALALIGYFAPRVWSIVSGALGRESEPQAENRRLIGRVVLGCIPAVLAGVLLEGPVEAASSRMAVVGILLVINGGLLYGTRFRPRAQRRIGWGTAMMIGMIQALAILPGISRSGSTIGLALLLGIGAEEAFDFSFLMALPLTAGAAVYELLKLDFSALAPANVALGICSALVSGLGAIVLLHRIVVRGRFYRFGLYCGAVGIILVVVSPLLR
ncbi:MAG: undecaprenyl-diphosphate phosphatase [candidate division WOR-3 bacterium]